MTYFVTMIILLSPSKKLAMDSDASLAPELTMPRFSTQMTALAAIMQEKSVGDIRALMSLRRTVFICRPKIRRQRILRHSGRPFVISPMFIITKTALVRT